jgi:hypothetical protein
MTEAEILALIQEKKALGSDPTKIEITDLAKVLKSFQDAIFGEVGGVTLSDLSPTTNQIPKWNGTAWVASNDQTADAGTGASLDTVLGIGNTTDKNIVFSKTPVSVPTALTKEWMRFTPLSTQTGASTFYWHQFAVNQGSVVNEVMNFGWNLGAGGGAADAAIPGLGESWESNYSPGGQRWVEKHEFYIAPSGFGYAYPQIRLSSYTINTITGSIDYYMTVGRWSIKVPYSDGGRVYTAVQPGTTGGKWYVGYNEVSNVGFEYDKATGANLYGSGFDGNSNLNITGFTGVKMPGLWVSQAVGMRFSLNMQTDPDAGIAGGVKIGLTGNPFHGLLVRSKAGLPTASDTDGTGNLASGYWGVWKNTTDGAVNLCYNDGGTIKKIALT